MPAKLSNHLPFAGMARSYKAHRFAPTGLCTPPRSFSQKLQSFSQESLGPLPLNSVIPFAACL